MYMQHMERTLFIHVNPFTVKRIKHTQTFSESTKYLNNFNPVIYVRKKIIIIFIIIKINIDFGILQQNLSSQQHKIFLWNQYIFSMHSLSLQALSYTFSFTKLTFHSINPFVTIFFSPAGSFTESQVMFFFKESGSSFMVSSYFFLKLFFIESCYNCEIF